MGSQTDSAHFGGHLFVLPPENSDRCAILKETEDYFTGRSVSDIL